MLKILLVDDDEVFCSAVSQMLEAIGHQVVVAHSIAEAKSQLKIGRFTNVVLDFMLPDGSGLHVIDDFKDDPEAPNITLVTGHPSAKTLMSGLCNTKINHLIKPVTLDDIKRALSFSEAPENATKKHFGCLVGESPPMQELYKMIERVSKTKANVMLIGESGVGKEVVAQAIHNASGAKGALVAANCGAFPQDLISSELFGHEKGAFTGAVARKIGLFEQANDGNLFLDEVTEMPLESQPSLLRVLETGQITRVGGVKPIDVNCRVISATNRKPETLAENNILREDLYFRLAVFPINIPSLRERKEDIEALAESFLTQLNYENGTNLALTEEQIATLTAYDWPGNVRELRHLIHRAFIMSDPSSGKIELPANLSSPFSSNESASNGGILPGKTIDDVERELITATLREVDGDKPMAAKMLGVSLKTLYNRLNKYQGGGLE